ncbi:hypothetical protein [Bradyrhizobium sp.]|uniref:hypothetical protein n=1 Tax=Bradyrhizobium sp. TaxID=376 RepID=UPI0025BFB7C8|nr:hypothetical protein [Bradyrhizobium sp.]
MTPLVLPSMTMHSPAGTPIAGRRVQENVSASTVLDSTSLSAMTPSKSKMMALTVRRGCPH